MTKVHDWRLIRQLAKRAGVRIMNVTSTTDRIVSLRGKIGNLLDEAEGLGKIAEKEGRELNDTESARFSAIMDEESGELARLHAELKAVEKQHDERKRLALMQDAYSGSPRDPFGTPPGVDDRVAAIGTSETEASRPTLVFKDKEGQVVRSLGLNDRFAPQQRESFDDAPRYSLADRIHAHLTGNPLPGIQGNIWTGTDGSGGFLTSPEVFGSVFDLARPNSVAFKAGAQTIPMGDSEMVLVQQLTDPEVHWTPELAAVPASTLTFGRIRLKAKKLAAIVPVSIEMMEDAANAPQLIQSAIVNAMGQALDQAILSGSGVGEEPRGVRAEPGVNTHSIASPPAADYIDLEAAIELIDNANYPGDPSELAWIMHPRDASQYARLQASDLQPLQPTAGAAALMKYKTTSLPTNLGGGAASEMIVGDMSQVVVGMRTGATVRFLPAGSVSSGGETLHAAQQYATLIVVHMRCDVAIVRPQWLTVVDGVTWS